MFVLVIVDDVVLVFTDDVHRAQYIQSIVNAPLHVFEINFLAHLAEIFVHVKNFVRNLSASDHRSFSHLLQN